MRSVGTFFACDSCRKIASPLQGDGNRDELYRHREFLIDPRLGPEQPHRPAAVLAVNEPGNRLIAKQEDGIRGRVTASIDSGLDTASSAWL